VPQKPAYRRQAGQISGAIVSSLTSSSFLPLQPVAAGAVRKSGRAVCGDRGDAVWEWQVATGVFERDVTDEQLRLLEAPDLQIVEFNTPATNQGRWIHDSGTFQATSFRKPLPKTVTRQPGALAQFWALLRGVS
jgi:hypothetical protein